ncbi:MAG TPA: response regulator [candidate division WWE3 bacterium]|uniref:Response regulator n=1 Tax=candidate division WWE3 bacterium TaxID=2053526 RepID=A0A7C1HVH3_UNCKA|nr:response regulator [candidate division WWE3 bacterium]
MAKKIIIAEDDKFLANAYRLKLEKEGFEIEIVANGKELIAKIPEFKPNIILLDLLMPLMDGFEALEILKSDKNTKNIPVLIMSNLGQQSDIDKGKELGAKDYIIKSNISLKKVIEKIEGLLK